MSFTGKEIEGAFRCLIAVAPGAADPDLDAFNEALDLGMRPAFETFPPEIRDAVATLFLLGLKCGRDIARARELD